MKYFIFGEDITKDTIGSLINHIVSENDDCTIYFTSGGGDVTFAENFIDFTFRFPKKITLICNYSVSSCAFDVLMKSNTKKEIKDGCFGLIHLQTIEGNLREFLYPQDSDTKFVKKDLDRSNKENAKFYRKIGISEPLLTEFLEGRDAIIDTKLMKIIAKNAEKLVCKEKKLSKKEKEELANEAIKDAVQEAPYEF